MKAIFNCIAPAVFLALLCLCAPARAQTVDYVYSIEYGVAGNGASGSTWYLDQIAINVNAGGTPTGYTLNHLLNLTSYVTGWDAAGTTRGYQCINALAIDPVTNTFFFTYSYNSNTTNQTSGTFTAVSYALRIGYTGSATQINTYSDTTRTTGSAGSPGTPGSSGVQAGWFTKGAFYNGSYYVGIQTNTSNNLVQFTLAANENSVVSRTVYTNINHTGADASQGGDLVFDSNGNMYMSGRNSGGTQSTFATETLANATSTSGTAWNSTSVTGDGDYYQLAGLGQIPRLYGYSGNTHQFGVFSNFTNPAATSPSFTVIGSGTMTTMSDMSDGANHSLVTPEPSTWAAGAAGCGMVAVSFWFRRRRGI